MTIKAKKFRVKRGGEGRSERSNAQRITPNQVQVEQEQTPPSHTIDGIRAEGLTPKQLRLARRRAVKEGMIVASDFDAVLQLRAAGINPFQGNSMLDLAQGDTVENTAQSQPQPEEQDGHKAAKKGVLGQLQLRKKSATELAPRDASILTSAGDRSSEILQIQRDLTLRRQRKAMFLALRLLIFVIVPTLVVGWYYFVIATPMYATQSEFVIQQNDSSGLAGTGSLLQGTSAATQQDSTTVQSYLASRAAMKRLDEDHGFKAHFSGDNIDFIERLSEDATNEAAFDLYQSKVRISYDPTEGILRMETIAASPEVSQQFSEALVGYAEEQVDQLTARLRNDRVAGAQKSFEDAQRRRVEALDRLSMLQAQSEILDPASESGALMQRVTNLEVERDRAMIKREELLENSRPNRARVDASNGEIERLDRAISNLRAQMASSSNTTSSLAQLTAELRKAEENYQTELLLLQNSQTQLESAAIEADRQARYLAVGVEPVASDEATYPKSFQNTILGFLILLGSYLMVSITISVLREQVMS